MFAITAELAIMAYFFAMRSCEFTLTPLPGRTKIIHLRGVVFHDKKNQEVDHLLSPHLHLTERVTITFENQMNGTKNEKGPTNARAIPSFAPSVAWRPLSSTSTVAFPRRRQILLPTLCSFILALHSPQTPHSVRLVPVALESSPCSVSPPRNWGHARSGQGRP